MSGIGELISLGTALCWTITVISFEYAGKKVGSLSVNFIRLILGFILLAITVFFFTGNFIPLDADSHTWIWLLSSGLIGLVIGDLFLFQAFVDVGGRISLLIMSAVPVMSAILGLLFLNEVLSATELIGMIITITAIIIVVLSRKKKGEKYHPHIIRGIFFAAIGAIAQAVGLIFSKIGMGDYNAFAATQIRVIAAIFGFIIILSLNHKWGNVKRALPNKRAMWFIALGSFFGPFLGVSSSLLAMQYTSVGVATTISQTNVILIIPFSIILFKEKVNIIEIIGSLIAFVGVAILILL